MLWLLLSCVSIDTPEFLDHWWGHKPEGVGWIDQYGVMCLKFRTEDNTLYGVTAEGAEMRPRTWSIVDGNTIKLEGGITIDLYSCNDGWDLVFDAPLWPEYDGTTIYIDKCVLGLSEDAVYSMKD